jgi:galactokinase
VASELSQPALVRVASVFERAFGGRPSAVGRAPGRVNLIGDHVDYAEGFAMPIAINCDAVAAVREAPDGRWRVASGEMPVQVELPDPLSASPIVDQRERWANFVLGVLVAVANEGIRVPPLQIAVSSDVPMGGGLASSAALEASVATAVCEVVAAPFFGLPLARLCQEAEHRFAGVPCGLMDQVTTILARAGQALLIDCRTLDCRYVPMPPQAAVLVVDTGIRHDLADGRYAERRAQVEEAARLLGMRALRDADETVVRNARLPEPVAARARHVVRETQRTLLAANALRRGDLELLGMLMYQSHQSLREDFAVSVPELDAIVDEARAAGVGQGIFGARMTGGGFGGCAVVLVDAAHVDAATARIAGAFSRRFRRQPTVRRVEAAAGAGLVRQVAAL